MTSDTLLSRMGRHPAEQQPVFTRISESLADALSVSLSPAPDWLRVRAAFAGWDADMWSLACFVACLQGIAPLLHTRLGARMAGGGDFAPIFRDYLAEQCQSNRLRMERWRAMLQAVLREANARDVPLLLLKGSHTARFCYDDPGERVLADIDLFITSDRLDDGRAAIIAAGFPEGENMARHVRFLGPNRRVVRYDGEHPDNRMDIELHTKVADQCFTQAVDLTPLLREHWREISFDGARVFVLSPAGMFAHALLHGAANVVRHTWRLIQLWDLVLLASRMSVEDWAQLRQLVTAVQGGGWAYAPAQLVERYRPGAIPAGLLSDWRAQAPPLVRARAEGWGITDVSLCNLRRLSLGNRLQWARSPAQALDYLWQKVVPPADQARDFAAWLQLPAGRWSAYVSYYRVASRWLRPSRLRHISLNLEKEKPFYEQIRR